MILTTVVIQQSHSHCNTETAQKEERTWKKGKNSAMKMSLILCFEYQFLLTTTHL